ncbi:MAG: glycosyltransferase [Planctomycetes bacterium]|nr:glycosyltransferase [Planctomycetota bacterium]
MDGKGARVLQLCASMAGGGAERTMLGLARALGEQGLRSLVAVREGGYLHAAADRAGIPFRLVRIRGSLDPLGIRALRRIVRRDGIDIVHAHDGKTYWPCLFVKWLGGGRPKVVLQRTLHKPHKFYSRAHYRFADAVIAVSRCVARDLIDREGAPAGKMHVIYNGIDTGVFNREVAPVRVRQACGLGSSLVVGTAGPLGRGYDKGQEYLIRAAAQLRTRFPDLKLLIVGDGDLRPELEALTRQLGLGASVVFAGYQERIEDFYAAMDVFCLLSWRNEGLGNVMLEAQAMGKPVVGTDVGGIPETFEDGSTGLLVPARDVDALTRALETLLRDEALRREMGARAAERIRVRFSQEAAVRNTIEVYDRVLAPARALPAAG